MIRIAGVAILAALSSGCTLLTATPPDIAVADVRLLGLGVLEQALSVSLCVTNPNDSELAFRRVTIGIDVAGAPLAESASDTAVRLPPRSSVLVPFSVVATLRNAGPQLLGIIGSGGVEYRLHGTVQIDGSLASTVPFSRAGRLDLLATGGDLLADATMPAPNGCRSPS